MPGVGSFTIGISAIGIGSSLIPVGYQQLPLTDVSELDVPDGAILAVLIVEGAAVRYRDDGTPASPTVGMPLADGKELHYLGNLNALSFAPQESGAILNILFYG